MGADAWLVTGAQASGKSTIADLLARQFPKSVHVRGGQFCRWAVRGCVRFDDQDRPEDARELHDLRYRLSADVAQQYADHGFSCVVQDNIYGPDVMTWLARIRTHRRHLVVLRPTIEVIRARGTARRSATGKIAYSADYTVAHNDADLAATPRDVGPWLDTSQQRPDETVKEILHRETEALVH